MTDLTLYHNPRCSKSRGALELLEARGLAPTIVRYLETPPDTATLTALLGKLGIAPRQLLRSGEDEYKTLNLADPALTDAQLIEAMAQHPKLIELSLDGKVLRTEPLVVQDAVERGDIQAELAHEAIRPNFDPLAKHLGANTAPGQGFEVGDLGEAELLGEGGIDDGGLGLQAFLQRARPVGGGIARAAGAGRKGGGHGAA